MSVFKKISIKDNSQTENQISKFFGDIFHIYIHKKVKKIAHAIFLVTNHIREDDNLRESLRPVAIKIIDLSVKINHLTPDNVKKVLYNDLTSQLISVNTLLELATHIGVIGEANYNILRREMFLLIEDIHRKIQHSDGGYSRLSPGFFDVDIRDRYGDVTPQNLSKNVKDKVIKDKILLTSDTMSQSLTDKKEIKKNVDKEEVYKGQELKMDSPTRVHNRIINVKNAERAERGGSISDLFKKDVSMSAKDVHLLLPKYSEKMIQRELSKLVLNGFLAKKGSKRWTVYFKL